MKTVKRIEPIELMLPNLLIYSSQEELNKAIEEARVQKQLDAIEDRDLAEKIASHFNQKLLISMDGIIFLWMEYKDKDKETKSRGYVYIVFRVLDWISIWLDYYMVARMFRSFEKSKGGYSSEPARNVIGYMGNAHCDGISDFLRTLPDFVVGERSESKQEGKDHQCLRVSSRLPLFKYD
jgi:hypothetical protein